MTSLNIRPPKLWNSPISQKHFGNVCELTQLFGENKNRLFYGAGGH